MSKSGRYFNRDISWLSFNYRVLEEASDKNLPLYERLKFLAIYSSNLDEFYKVRVAEYKYNFDPEETEHNKKMTPTKVINEIMSIVDSHLIEFKEIFNDIHKELNKEGVILYQGEYPSQELYQDFIKDYFLRRVLPYLQPIIITKGVKSFLRDNRLYLAIRLYRKVKDNKQKKKVRRARYAILKLPTNDLPRFIKLPNIDNKYHYLFLDDLVRFNLQELFPGYDIDSSYSIKLLRDADLGIKDEFSGDLVEKIKKNLGLRLTGEPTLFTYDRDIPTDFLNTLKDTFNLHKNDLLASDRYLNFHDFFDFPNPFAPKLELKRPEPSHPKSLEEVGSMFKAVKIRDRLLHYPYQSFDYLLRFLNEAALDPKVEEIKLTQYRVAHDSAVVNSLIGAARNGKKVSVFVEVKARFDEENNLLTARVMEEAGIKIIYSLPGLKVHAKMALVIRKDGYERKRSYAYLSTGNFNEKTAKLYSDFGYFTSKENIIFELEDLFYHLENQEIKPKFKKLLVTQFNFKSQLVSKIDREIKIAKKGGDGYILLKMNGMQNKKFINKLYEASEAGVKIDLIIRGICSVVPDQPYSKNIRIIRIVDSNLEHARIWVFNNEGNKEVYMTSADWMNRNINRRIEVAFPIEEENMKNMVLDILNLQLNDNVKARIVDSNLVNQKIINDKPPIRSQWATYELFSDGKELC